MNSNKQLITVKPEESFEVLVNPGMGWTTWCSFNQDEKNKNYPLSSIAYFRFSWRELEPEEGKYQWDIIDNLLQKAHQRGQKLAFRISTANGGICVPEWFSFLISMLWENKEPTVKLAIKGRDKDGWYPMSILRIKG